MMTVYVGREGNIQWELNRKTHILELDGEGILPGFYPFLGDLPSWLPFREDVRDIHIGQGITRIGDYAFYPYDHGIYADMRAPLRRVTFPPSLESIGRSAFRANTHLLFIDLSGLSSLRTIEEYAFASCFEARAVDLSGCVCLEKLDARAFWGCDELDYINLEGCLSLTDEALRFLRENTPPGVPIIMPDGWISCEGASSDKGKRECRIFLRSTYATELSRRRSTVKQADGD